MAEAPPFKLEDLKAAGIEENLQVSITRFEIDSLKLRHYSITGTVRLYLNNGTEQTVFFKKHTPELHQGDTFATRENLLHFHTREGTNLKLIYNGRHVPPLVPQLLGRRTEPNQALYVLFTEFVDAPCAKDDYLELSKEMQKVGDTNLSAIAVLQEKKIQLLQRDLGQIARFSGLCNTHIPST